MNTNLWKYIKKITAILTVLTQILLPAAGADVVPLEMQNQGIPAIAEDDVIASDTAEVPSSSFDTFFTEEPLTEATSEPIVKKTDLLGIPVTVLPEPEADEIEPFIGNDPRPLDTIPFVSYLVAGTKNGVDLSLNFDSLDEAKAFVKGALEATKVGTSSLVSFAQVDGPAFEVIGSAVLISYEETDNGVTVYLKNEVKSVKGTLITAMQWQEQYAVNTRGTQFFDAQGRLVKEVRRDGTQIHYHHSDTGVEGVTIIDRQGNTTKVEFEIQGLTVSNARKIATAALDLIQKVGLEDGAVIYLAQFRGNAAAELTLRTGLTFYRYHAEGRKATFLSQESAAERLERRFIKAFIFLQELQAADSLTLQDAKKMSRIQASLKALIEMLPQDQWPTWIAKFNQYLDASDRIVATKPLCVIVDGGRELLVRNHTDLFTKIIQRFKMMDQTGEIDLRRLAGIDTADLEGLETFTQYIAGRQIGAGSGFPLFDLSSPLGNLELIDRLVRKYAAAEDVSEVEGPVEVIQDDFLRYVDGTQQAFQHAMQVAKRIFGQYPVSLPSNPLTVESILTSLKDLERLNSHLSQEIADDIALFRGEEVFKKLLIDSVSNALMNNTTMGNAFYRQIFEQVSAPLSQRDVIFSVGGKDVRVSRSDLDGFANRLPWDSIQLSRYPGVAADIDASFFATVVSAGYYNRLSYVDLRNPAIPSMTGTGAISFSYPAQRFQLLEQFLKTWPEVIRADNTVDFDRLRFRLLISYELELALGRAEEYLNGRIQAMQAFGEKKSFTVEDYAAMKEMLRSTQGELAQRFNPLLQDVIYDTTNEVTARIQARFQGLVNSFTSVLSRVQVTVQGPNGTSIVFDSKTVQNEVLEKILNASGIRINGSFPREAFLRIHGIDENLLSGLLSPEKIAGLKYFTFYHYDSQWQGPGFANEEILFALIPALVKMFETADVDRLSAKMTEGMALPVPLGEVLENQIKNAATGLIQRAKTAMNVRDLRTLEDLSAIKEVFEQLHADLRMLADLNRDGKVDSRDLSEPELGILESWANGNWNGDNIAQVNNLFNARIAGVAFLDVDGVRVPVSQILAIAGFPYARDFNTVLFPGLQPEDFENTETSSERAHYQYFRFLDTDVNPADRSLSPLGRIEAAVHVAARLIKSLDPSSKVFFINAEGNREIDPNEFRKFIKGVYAMRQAILAETRKLVRETAAELEGMKKGSYTIKEIEVLHAKVLSLRSSLIQLLSAKANIHERQDVLSVENEVSLIFQKGAFDLFVSIVGAAKLTIEIDGKIVSVPAKAITDALIAYLKTKVGDSIAAHHFATLYGISVEDVRKAHKLENYMSEQIVALPKNSEYVQIVSQLSELGYMQLAAELVKRYGKDVIRDGEVDVKRLVELATDKDRAVAQIKQDAIDLYTAKSNELREAAGESFGFEALNRMVGILEDAKGGLVSMMNDFLSGNSDEVLLKDLEDLVNGLYGKLKISRDGIMEKTPFVYEVNGRKISILLNKKTIARFGQAVADWLAANPGVTPIYEEPIYGWDFPSTGVPPVRPVYMEQISVAKGMVDSYEMPVSFKKGIGIWQPFPDRGSYNPGDHPTEFGLAVLFARLAVKYGEFAVDENGFNLDLFLIELQSTDQSRAERRLQVLLDKELPALKYFIASLRQGGALSVDRIGEINAKFGDVKERVRFLGNDAQSKAMAVWAEFMRLYETSLFEGKLSVDIDGKRVTFEPKVLNDILLKLFQENKLDKVLMEKFSESIQTGETSWQYDEFKNLSYYRGWLNYGFGFDPWINTDFQEIKDEKLASLELKAPFTLGDLARIPGISAKDLNGLDVVEKDYWLRLTPVDPVKLLGLLDMRALAPGSGVATGGLMANSSMSMRAEAIMLDSEQIMILREGPQLAWKSFRFNAFDLIPAMIREMGKAILRDGAVVPAYFSLALEGKLVGFLYQQSALLKAADDEIAALEADVEGGSAGFVLTPAQIAGIEAQIKEQRGNYAALLKNLQAVQEQQGVSAETRAEILSFLKPQSEGGESLNETELAERTAQFMSALIFNNQQRQIYLNITRVYLTALKEYRSKIADAQTLEELWIPKLPFFLPSSIYALEEDPRGFLEPAIERGTLLLERERLEIQNWKPAVQKTVRVKNDPADLPKLRSFNFPSLLTSAKNNSRPSYRRESSRGSSERKKKGAARYASRIAGSLNETPSMRVGTTQTDFALNRWNERLRA